MSLLCLGTIRIGYPQSNTLIFDFLYTADIVMKQTGVIYKNDKIGSFYQFGLYSRASGAFLCRWEAGLLRLGFSEYVVEHACGDAHAALAVYKVYQLKQPLDALACERI